MTADTVTVLQSRYLILAKTVHADGRIVPYGNARSFNLHEIPVSGLDALLELLMDLLPRQWCAVTFGGIIDPNRTQAVRRLAYPDPETGDQPTLRAVAHRWCALDLDGVARPESVPAYDPGRMCRASRPDPSSGLPRGALRRPSPRCEMSMTRRGGGSMSCRFSTSPPLPTGHWK